MEKPGIKQYSPNFFLENHNDLTRIAYQKDTKATVNDNKSLNHFEVDTIINSKESFESSNKRINDMQDEISELKTKLKTIYEKEEEIHKLKLEINNYKKEQKETEAIQKALIQLKNENKQLRDDNDLNQIKLLNNQSIQQENKLLKEKLREFETNETNEMKIEDLIEEEEEIVKDEKIPIDIPNLKGILNNRLKTYHDKHIDNLIDTYDLKQKKAIDKTTMEKLLFEAIHI